MSYSDLYAADLRGSILVILDAADCETSLGVLRASLARATPHDPPMNRLGTEVSWLAQRGLVDQRKIDGVVEGVHIAERGRDVARGRERVGGVAPPESDG
ncbi:MAG: hypothetical protein F4Y34_08245 [Gammaproteobacteria bacterium]|nr:hypothetical protein [Gammaproteobacteria bacterium]